MYQSPLNIVVLNARSPSLFSFLFSLLFIRILYRAVAIKQYLYIFHYIQPFLYFIVYHSLGPNTPIRLNGTAPNSGQVELEYGSSWRTICPGEFDIKDATVICRMLGFKIG